MPTKRNWAGEQQEYIPAGSSKGGEYAGGSGLGGAKFDGKVEQDFNDPRLAQHNLAQERDFGKEPQFDIDTEQDSIYKMPEEHQNTRPIKDEASFNQIKANAKVIGKDGKEYSYDEPFIKEWIDGVNEKARTQQTFFEDLENGGMSPERLNYDRQQINEEIESQKQDLIKNGSQPKYERQATFVFGLPAAGKSSLAEPLKKEMGAFEIDADLMKQRIPEFQNDPQMVSAVHEESSFMSKEMNKQLLQQGANLVIGKVGGEKNYKSIKKMIDQLKSQGYKINVVVAHKDVDKALESNLGRFINRLLDKENWKKKPPRIVNTNEHFNTQKTYFDTSIKLFNDGDIDGYKFYDVNDKQPRLIRENKKGN